MNEFVQNQWSLYCEKLNATAEYLAREDASQRAKFLQEASEFTNAQNVTSYSELLEAISAGSELTNRWKSAVRSDADSSDAYQQATNHEPMAVPQETIAEQAEQVRSHNSPDSR